MADTKNIKSVFDLGQFEQSFEEVSVLRLQKIKQQTENYKQFMKDFLEIFSSIDFSGEYSNNTSKDLVFVISTDNCISGNSNVRLFKKLKEEYKNKKDSLDVYCIGQDSLQFFLNEGFNVIGYTNLPEEFAEQDFSEIYQYIENSISDNLYSNIKVCFNHFKNSLIRIPANFTLLPFDQKSLDSFAQNMNFDLKSLKKTSSDFMVGSNLQELKAEMIKQLLGYMLYGAALQNKIGELSSNILLMKTIKNNNKDTVRGFVSSFNKIRQNLLTKNVSRIVSLKMFAES
ncbi:MAG TPA: F0F1 ATP synthase subunit gamma [Candidatus Absconditabacterales bacterium]|nr:F0F1 ATP synthase subunit gamma [Candidatus Absconditabacterales bacterium]